MEHTHTNSTSTSTQKPCPEWAAALGLWADGAGSEAQRARTAAHVAQCAACARAAQEQPVLRRALTALPPRQTTAHFEPRLAARLDDIDRQRARAPWWPVRWAEAVRAVLPRPARAVLAVGAACVAVASAVFFGHLPSAPVATPAPPPITDTALLSHCVEQNHAEAAAQPLADFAAQNLASRMDGTAAAASDSTGAEDGL